MSCDCQTGPPPDGKPADKCPVCGDERTQPLSTFASRHKVEDSRAGTLLMMVKARAPKAKT